jgi:hypothetical protein
MLDTDSPSIKVLLSDFSSRQAGAILELAKQMRYITPYSNRLGPMRGKMHIGNPEEDKTQTKKWYMYSDRLGKQYIHPPGNYTGRNDSYLYELLPSTDYAAYLRSVEHDTYLETLQQEYCISEKELEQIFTYQCQCSYTYFCAHCRENNVNRGLRTCMLEQASSADKNNYLSMLNSR